MYGNRSLFRRYAFLALLLLPFGCSGGDETKNVQSATSPGGSTATTTEAQGGETGRTSQTEATTQRSSQETSTAGESGETTVGTERVDCNGQTCAENEECCVTQEGASPKYSCVTKGSCEGEFEGAVVCRNDGMCPTSDECCCKIPILNEWLCLPYNGCFGRTPCQEDTDCLQINEDFLPMVCCPSGRCDIEANCRFHETNPQPVCSIPNG
ncbi:MAG: hypothetical protein D6812_14550 [Deltaproteobacteria bacterium]|nr:MAG: hypothetical protein D6812_14550 [Deltaproteobacteria bacterium]